MDAREKAVATGRAWRTQPCTQPEKSGSDPASSPCLVRIYSDPETDETVVALRGEIDYGCEETLETSLTSALNSSDHGIAIDLSKVSFWACSSVKVLLAVRQLALRHGKTVSLLATSPIAHRVLELTDALQLFTTRTDATFRVPPQPTSPWGPAL